MNYTRKRALLACDFCRHRKRRCDGQKPCSTCRDSNADCIYKELPFDRVEPTSPGAVIERLNRIETLLEEHGHRLNDLSHPIPGQIALSRPQSFSSIPQPHLSSPELIAASPASASNRSHDAIDVHLEQTQFLIPYNHSTSANFLLALPKVRSFLGEFPRDYFYSLEENQPLPQPLDLLYNGPILWPALNQVELERLADNYYEYVHPNYPLFGTKTFKIWHRNLLANGPAEDLETAVCFCVYALGCAASPVTKGKSAESSLDEDAVGMRFFQPALRIILHCSIWGFKPNIIVCQALVLAASYFAHLGRPLHSWKMVYYASHKLQYLFDKRKISAGFTEYDDADLRLFWACFMIECDRAAELDVPRSGIEPLANQMALPRSMDAREDHDIIYFMAETAIRKLLNRIHSSLYSTDNWDIPPLAENSPAPGSLSVHRLLALSSELNRQLEEWYYSIPANLRPPIGVESITNDRGKVLRIRYYAARHIIHRPFVLYVATQTGPSPSGSSPATPTGGAIPIPRVVLEKCEICIASCRNYLYNVVEMLDKRSPYLWTFSQSCMACLLVLSIADACPQLRPLTPEIKPLQAMVLLKLQRWATRGSSFEAEVRILESLKIRGPLPTDMT